MTDYVDKVLGYLPGLQEKLSSKGIKTPGGILGELIYTVRFAFNFLINGIVWAVKLVTGLPAFFLALYTMIPTALNQLTQWFSSFRSAFNQLYSPSALSQSVNQVNSTVESITSYSPAGSTFWDWVKYGLNADVFISTIQFLAGVLFVWVQVCVVVCILVTALLFSGAVTYATRKSVKLLSAGFIDV